MESCLKFGDLVMFYHNDKLSNKDAYNSRLDIPSAPLKEGFMSAMGYYSGH